MRTFFLDRAYDESGVSGTGRVAQGVEFDDGVCVLRWLTEHRSTAIYNSSVELERIHGHAGRTKIVWVDDPSSLVDLDTPHLKIGFEGANADYACEHNCGPALPGARERYDRIQKITAPSGWTASASWFVSGQICLRVQSPEVFVKSVLVEGDLGTRKSDYYSREVCTFAVGPMDITALRGIGTPTEDYAVFVDGVPGLVFSELYYR